MTGSAAGAVRGSTTQVTGGMEGCKARNEDEEDEDAEEVREVEEDEGVVPAHICGQEEGTNCLE